MAFREFLARHRVASTAAAPAVLGVAAVVTATWALTTAAPPQEVDTQLTSSVTECHDMVTISVAGRNDTPEAGTTKMLVGANGELLPAALSSDYSSHWVDPVVNAPAGAVGPDSYAAVYIAYPANMDTYESAVNTGVENSKQVMREISKACPDTRFSIVGYSEGADVARRVAMDIGKQEAAPNNEYGIVNPDNVVGVVILADAGRAAGDGPFPGAKDPFGNPDNFNQRYQVGKNTASGQGALPGTGGDFGALNGKIASFCSDGDLTCAAPQNISLLQLAANVGRQLNVDSLQKDGLTPATGQDVAVTLSQIAFAAFADIQSQPNWLQSDETFLDVLLKVSDPGYKPGATKPPTPTAISSNEMSSLAYLPQKVLNEIVGLIVTNQNTIPVVMSDPYQLTLGPNGTGHHFDYWRDSDTADGKPLSSAEYAGAWLTHLAKQAQAGEPVQTSAKPQPADLAAAYQAVAETSALKTGATAATTTPAAAAAAAATTTTPPMTAAALPLGTLVPVTLVPVPVAAITPEPIPNPIAAIAGTTEPATTEPTTTEAAAATTTTATPVPGVPASR